MSTAIPKTAGLVTMRYVVMSVLNRMNDYSMKSYLRLLQIGIELFSEELSMFHIGAGSEVVYLHMSDAKTVPFPSDYIDYVKIGYPSEGKLVVITKKDSILLPRVWDDGDESAIGNFYGAAIGAEDVSNIIFFQDHWRGGVFVGGLYGLPGAIDTAYFREDRENRQFVFSGSTPRSEIVLEYISTGLKADGSSLIPRQCVSALRTGILWLKDENDPRVAFNAKERLKIQHEQEIEALRSFSNSFTADEYLRMIYQTSYQSPKR